MSAGEAPEPGADVGRGDGQVGGLVALLAVQQQPALVLTFVGARLASVSPVSDAVLLVHHSDYLTGRQGRAGVSGSVGLSDGETGESGCQRVCGVIWRGDRGERVSAGLWDYLTGRQGVD